MEKKHRPGRSRSFASAGGGLAAFLRSTVASFSSASSSSAAAFQSHGGKASFNHRNAFSGPIVSIVPPEARGGGRDGSGSRRKRSGYRTPEPSSPKVSCIGQIKRSKSKKKVNPCGKSGGACPLPPRRPVAAPAEGSCKPKGSSFVKRMFSRRSMSRSRSRNGRPGHGKGAHAAAAAAPAPAGIGQMKRFTSGRAAFQDFDWREAEMTDHDDYGDDDEGFVAHSAPLVLGGGVVAMEPRKEVNLWRRRPMAPPAPLQLP